MIREKLNAMTSPSTTFIRNFTSRGRPYQVEAYRDWLIVLIVNNVLLAGIAVPRIPIAWRLTACLLLSVGFAIGAIIVLHDAGHHRFSRHYIPNMLTVNTAVPVGLWVAHWTIKHRAHHRLPAAYPDDGFTQANGLLRLHPEAPYRSFYRFQHIYAGLIYTLMLPGELLSQVSFLIKGSIGGERQTTPLTRRLVTFSAEKLVTFLVLLPYLLVSNLWNFLVLLTASCVLAGFITACILVIGHVNVGLVYERRDDGPFAWQSYVVSTTASFSTASPTMAWITGGLTHHLVHHLYPQASRKQLRAMYRTTVAAVEERVHITSVEFSTFRAALRGHWVALKKLGSGATDLSAVGLNGGSRGKGETLLKSHMAELIDSAILTEETTPVCIIKEAHQAPR